MRITYYYMSAFSILGLVALYYKLDNTETLLTFALLALVLALLFAHYGTLGGKSVDFFYYSLMMFAVIGVFINETTDRQSIRLAKKIHALSDSKVALEHSAKAFEHMIDRPDEVFAQLQTASAELSEQRRKEFSQAECIRILSSPRFGDMKRQPVDPQPVDLQRMFEAAAECERYGKENERKVNALLQLSKLQPGTGRHFDLTTLDGYNPKILIDRVAMPLQEVLLDLSSPTRPREKLVGVQAEISRASEELEQNRKKFEELSDMTAGIDKWSSPYAFFMKIGWPYFVVVLLGSKLAKHKYLSLEPASTSTGSQLPESTLTSSTRASSIRELIQSQHKETDDRIKGAWRGNVRSRA